MKKILYIALMLLIVITMFCGCNRQVMDMTFRYDRCVISLPDGEIVKGKVQSWLDFENSDMIQVKVDGKSYLVHSVNCVLIDD